MDDFDSPLTHTSGDRKHFSIFTNKLLISISMQSKNCSTALLIKFSQQQQNKQGMKENNLYVFL